MVDGEWVIESPLAGTVKRLRFGTDGETVIEDTFATEGERAIQPELGIGPGERPISTAGPLFAHDCEANAVPYKSDGALGHGWECGICGKFLQAG